MNDPHCPPPAASSEALLRYTVLAQVEALLLSGWALSEAVREVAERKHVHPDGRPVHLSVRTLQRWRAAYLGGNFAALEPRSRPRTETSLALSEALIGFLRTEKQGDPRASVPELLRRAEQQGIIGSALSVDRTTVWRACRRMGLPTRARPSKREGDMRRWRYPHRMQCVLADGKHFRAGAGRLRRVALVFLDDATRYGLGGLVGTSESTLLFLLGLYDMVINHGLAELLYLDRGPGFISADTLEVVQGGLGAWLIHGKARYPQGHGALERFNRTAGEQLLRSLDGAAEVDPACQALTLRLRHYLDRRFVVREDRKVSSDHVIKIDGHLWEAPRGLGNSWVQVTRHVLDARLWVLQEGRMVELAELDAHANATERRGYAADQQPLASEGVPRTAAILAFEHDLRPLVGPDGGFEDEEDKHNKENDL